MNVKKPTMNKWTMQNTTALRCTREPQHPHFCKDSTNCAHPNGELLSQRSNQKIQLEDMGNDACLLMGYHDMVRALMHVQVILYWNNLLIQLFIVRMIIWMTTIP
jgi:hypothetical protein